MSFEYIRGCLCDLCTDHFKNDPIMSTVNSKDTAEDTQLPMLLEVGKKYKTRDGKAVVEIIRTGVADTGVFYVGFATRTNGSQWCYTFKENGLYDDPETYPDNDLVEEYVPAVTEYALRDEQPTSMQYALRDEDGEPITSRPALITEDSPALKKWYDSINNSINITTINGNNPPVIFETPKGMTFKIWELQEDCKHEWADTGMKKTWCKKCDKDHTHE